MAPSSSKAACCFPSTSTAPSRSDPCQPLPIPGRRRIMSNDVGVRRNRVSAWLADRKVGTKILVSTGVVAAVAVGVGVVGINALGVVDEGSSRLYSENVAALVARSHVHQEQI